MTIQKAEDVKDTALKLDKIRTQHPEDYFYLKGWIHCLLQKGWISDSRQPNPTKQLNIHQKFDKEPIEKEVV